jgi:hypothetical protein
MVNPRLLGVVEGFYGREWSWDLRRRYAAYLADLELNSYLYCPKADAFLRKQWRQSWPAEIRAELTKTARCFRDRGLHWGVGLSPFALYRDYNPSDRRVLHRRVHEIDALGGDLLAVLFDDMPGDCPDLAARQSEIVADISHWSQASRFLVCPTYYSFDPVLERHFGARPPEYWETLGSALPGEVDIFWTGNRVCSPTVRREDLSAITEILGRPVLLWDNYPVNDGEKGCRFLNLRPLPGRDPDIATELSGHFCNPMNQGLLSRLPLGGLATLYGCAGRNPGALYSAEMAAALSRDTARFQDRGLDDMDAATRRELALQYKAIDDPAAIEVADWLCGRYAFDPACLTG